MRMVDIIAKKRDGHRLAAEEIQFVIQGYTAGDIPDYQMSALAMAIYFQGMERDEIADLTLAMVHSGDQVDLSAIRGIKVDKHSTGGVGDKTSLVVAPLVAAAGIPVAKMSGRGLGHTGGTVDKLEAIRGFQVELPNEQFYANVNEIGMALVGQSGNLTPADKKLYALRDVTATVNSIPLIASSVMSKKIASGADAIVLDVKVGSGAFMKSLDDAKQLADTMVDIGQALNRRTIAVLSDMNEPLGYAVGNANEVQEAIALLHGEGEPRLKQICLTLAAHMTVAGGAYADVEQAYTALEKLLTNGKAFQTFRQFVQAQGGDTAMVDDPSLLPQAAHTVEVIADKDGYVQAMHAEQIGIAAMLLGAGRATKDDTIDYAAGVTLRRKTGAAVRKGDVLAVLHTNRSNGGDVAANVLQAYTIGAERPAPTPIVHMVLGK